MTIKPEILEVLEKYQELLSPEILQHFLSSVKIVEEATNGWGEVTVVFKASEAKESRIVLTQKAVSDKSDKPDISKV